MLKLIFGALASGCCVYMGFNAVASLNSRVSVLQAWRLAVGILQAEITFSLSAIPQLLSLLQKQQGLEEFMEKFYSQWDGKDYSKLSEVWKKVSIGIKGLNDEEHMIISEIGTIIGHYDAESQVKSLIYIEKRLESAISKAEDKKHKNSRIYTMLGVVSGLVLLILVV